MKKNLLLAAVAVILVPLVILAYARVYAPQWFLAWKPPPADELEKAAMAEGDSLAQQQAATDLIGLGEPALPNVRRVLQQSKSPEVREIMLLGIAQMHDRESLEDIFKALDDDSRGVRVQALNAVRQTLFFDKVFPPNATHEERVKAIKEIRERLAVMKAEEEKEIREGHGKPKQGQQPVH